MINLDDKVFIAVVNSSNGEVGKDTLFYYSQTENIISAEYRGGDIINGHLLGEQLPSGEFSFVYHHINIDGELKVGKCLSSASYNNDGKIILNEEWQWLTGDMSKGKSELVEV